ncbi:MAG: GspH/FimT family pseudopilin [Burkholderiales bacterium]|nr:GspH/FimT family pseudopilin [Burkholderiales bacterium]
MLSRRHSGFSLVELIVGMAVLALLMALGVPQYATFTANARIRATSEGVTSGLNLARAEAVKRNARVEMVLTDDLPVEALVNAITPSTSGTNWMVREWVPSTNSFNFIEGKAGAEGSGREESGVIVASSSTDATYDGRITFTGFGAMAIGQPVSFQFTYPAAGTCAAASGPLRCLNINVSPGGQIRVCDPKVTDTKDTRAC